jgi:hypothetical protein
VNESSESRVKVNELDRIVSNGGAIRFGPIRFDNNNITKEDELMKRLLGILVASMFLASAAYAGEAMKDEKVKTEKSAKGEKSSKASKAKSGDKKAKAADTKGGAMGEEKAADKKAGATAEGKKSK